VDGGLPVFYKLRRLAFGGVATSMVAYLTAQFTNVRLFHSWSVSRTGRAEQALVQQLITLIASGYLFKPLAALADTSFDSPRDLAAAMAWCACTGRGGQLMAVACRSLSSVTVSFSPSADLAMD